MQLPDNLIPAGDTLTVGEMNPLFTLPEDEPESEESEFDGIDTEIEPKLREDFVGLLYVGHLEEECTVAGHKFLLRTPSQIDRLEIGPLHKPYVNTTTGDLAWMVLMVAAYLRKIDSTPAPEPLGPESPLLLRYEWLKESIYSDAVVTELFNKCLLLDGRARDQVERLNQLGKASPSPVN